jgi:hypothetical protein
VSQESKFIFLIFSDRYDSQLSEPFCGWVNSKDPRSVLDPNIKTISA